MNRRVSPGNRIVATLFVTALVAGLFDPYSFGDEGGELGLRSHSWQVVATALQALLLVVAAASAILGARRRALSAGSIESSLFLLLNVAYFLRDGTTRLAAGYSADTTVVLVLAIGLISRGAAIGLLARKVSSGDGVA